MKFHPNIKSMFQACQSSHLQIGQVKSRMSDKGSNTDIVEDMTGPSDLECGYLYI